MKFLLSILLFLMVVVTGGCGSDGPELAHVEGIVTLNGNPLPDHLVEFNPQAEGGTVSMSTTDSEGHYSLQFTRDKPGATPGHHMVRILNSSAGPSKVIPSHYASFDSPLAVTVERGPNTVNLELTSN